MFRRSLLWYSKIGVFLITLLLCLYAKPNPNKVVVTIPRWDRFDLTTGFKHLISLKVPLSDGENLLDWAFLISEAGKGMLKRKYSLNTEHLQCGVETGIEGHTIDCSDATTELQAHEELLGACFSKVRQSAERNMGPVTENHLVLLNYKPIIQGKPLGQFSENAYRSGGVPHPEAFYFAVKLRYQQSKQSSHLFDVVESFIDDTYMQVDTELDLNDHWIIKSLMNLISNCNIYEYLKLREKTEIDIVTQLHVSSMGVTTITFTTVPPTVDNQNDKNLLLSVHKDFGEIPVAVFVQDKIIIKKYNAEKSNFLDVGAEGINIPSIIPSVQTPFFFSSGPALVARSRTNKDRSFTLELDKYNHELIISNHHLKKGMPGVKVSQDVDCEYSIADNVYSNTQPAKIPGDENYEQPQVVDEQLANTPIQGGSDGSSGEKNSSADSAPHDDKYYTVKKHGIVATDLSNSNPALNRLSHCSDSGSAEQNHTTGAKNYYNDRYKCLEPVDKLDSEYEMMDTSASHQRTDSNVSVTSSSNSGSGGFVTRTRTSSQLSKKEKEGGIRIGEQSLLHYVHDTSDDLFSINSTPQALASGECLLVQEIEGVKKMLTSVCGTENKAIALSPQIKALFHYNQPAGADKKTGKKKHGANTASATTVSESANSRLNSWVKLLRETGVKRILKCPVCDNGSYCPCDRLDSVLQEAYPGLVALGYIAKKK